VANKRHARHMIRNVSLHKSSNKIAITDQHSDFIFIQEKFPSRRDWKKLNQQERKVCKDSLKINQRRLFKSYEFTKRAIENGSTVPTWYQNLMSFIEEIKQEIHNIEHSNYKISEPNIRGIKKEEKDNKIIYRPIALYEPKDKIICSITAKYLTAYFEHLFVELDCSYAFRPKNASNHVPNHHDCIQKIVDYKKVNNGLWVAECDIQKFFDTVEHNHIVKVFDELANKIHLSNDLILDPKARKIFLLFLSSFSFQKNILQLNEEWFKINRLPFGEFSWAEDKLNKKFGENYTSNNRIGVPQGNAISCFIANLILHNVDESINKLDPNIFYIRYCDDMILMHKEQDKCSEALKIFMKGINDNFLLYHEPDKILNYKETSVSRRFWKSKSKEPFFWGDKNVNESNVPWVSFVGYQIDFHGRVRVRKSTLKKETTKQVSETQKVLKALGKFHRNNIIEDQNARLSKFQIVFRTRQKLISMSVGRLSIHNHTKPHEQGLCWTNGFKMLKSNKISSRQLRYLDKTRNHQLQRVSNELKKIIKETESEVVSPKKKKKKVIYFGGAFSYLNFLKHNK